MICCVIQLLEGSENLCLAVFVPKISAILKRGKFKLSTLNGIRTILIIIASLYNEIKIGKKRVSYKS